MRRVIREVITLIRIERWLVVGEGTATPAAGADHEQIVEQIVLSEAELAWARELFRQISEQRRWEITRDDADSQHQQGETHA